MPSSVRAIAEKEGKPGESCVEGFLASACRYLRPTRFRRRYTEATTRVCVLPMLTDADEEEFYEQY